MDEMLHQPTGAILVNFIISLFFLTVVIAIRSIVLRAALQRGGAAEYRRRWIVNSRNALIMVLVIGLVAIWANELVAFAVSLIAIAAALVIATKELILCFSGAVLRTAANAFSLGDLIETAGVRGDVVDINVFATTLREVGPGKGSHQYTGRAVVVPNSLLLSNPLVNHSFMGDYQVHIITVPWSLTDDWRQAEKALLEAAELECAPFLEDARTHMRRVEDQQGLEPMTVEPRITIEITEPQKIHFLLRIPAPQRRQHRLEQAILRRFLENWAAGSANMEKEGESKAARD